MNEKNFSNPISLRNCKIDDEFWHREQELVRTKVIPYQWEALNDRVEGAAPSFCMRNFKTAGKMMSEKRQKGAAYVPPAYTFRGFEALPEDPNHLEEDTFYGFVFQDTDFSKWIEAVAYSLTQTPDATLEQTANEAIDIVCAAQLENGYLDTYYIINGMDKAFSNLRDHHELYCLGHLIEGAVAYYEATGKDKLLHAAERFADYVCEYFGEGEDQCKGYPGHEIAEMALVRLYQVTGKEKYLQLSRFFLLERGKQPFYYDTEDIERTKDKNPDRYAYNQAHKPVLQQDEAVGHAVRAVYLYSGMADVAKLTKDEAMLAACERLWDNIVNEKLYITGGIGGTHIGESFSFPYDLPNDTAYSETCAAIGLVFFARRMLEIAPDARYSDVMEMALYNTVLAGMALDGQSFFYVNPLEVFPEACAKDPRKFHVKSIRQKWFGCACCPPNIARMVGSVGAYAYTENDTTLWTHLYMGSAIKKSVGDKDITLSMETKMPWEGSAKATICCDEPVECTLAFRIPGWIKAGSEKIVVAEDKKIWIKDGYFYASGLWKNGEEVNLTFPMEVRAKVSSTKVRENVERIAITRGPITYCLEEIDNGKDLHLCKLNTEKLGDAKIVDNEELGHLVKIIELEGTRQTLTAQDELYADFVAPNDEATTLTFVPYYAWNNRGEGEMSVWVRY